MEEEKIKVKVVDAICGAGKAQPIGSQILTSTGYKNIEELKVGDKIFGEDGELHNLVKLYDRGIKDIFNVTFSDKSSTECCDEHLWSVYKPREDKSGKLITLTLRDIMSTSLYLKNKDYKMWRYFIPTTKPLNFEYKDITIDPYLLGLLIGDGTFCDSIQISNTEEDIIEYITNVLGEQYELKPRNTKGKSTITYNITCLNYRKIRNPLVENIRNYGLEKKKSHEKFIPKDYLYNSIDVRLNVLRGLIDTDGSVSSNGFVEYSTSSELLKEDVKYLAQSLGCRVVVSQRIPKYTYKGELLQGRTSYRIHIKAPEGINIFNSKKHLSKVKIKTYVSNNRSIRGIEYVGKKQCYCILVDNPTHLYLTNDCIVTHNTTAAINYINSPYNAGSRFMYVTPYLNEVQRIKECCPDKNFKDPQAFGSKLQDIFRLIERGENIITTHALFSKFTPEVINLVKLSGYILIMDEVADVVSQLKITQDDTKIILENFAHIEDGFLIWDAKDYEGEFVGYKNLCELGCITVHQIGKELNLLIWVFPIKVFKAFSEIFILTYIFDAQVQKYYYDYFGVEYEYLYVKDFKFTDEPQTYDVQEKYSKLINIYDKNNLNDIGADKFALSKAWYEKNSNTILATVLKNNVSNYFRNVVKTKADNCIWTTFKDYRPVCSGKGFANSFVALNMRATNEYRNRENVAYLANKFMNPFLKNFFGNYDIKVDEDAYALSELIQFIFRSRLRCNEPINLYIPSKRMRDLLCDWLNVDLKNNKNVLRKS